MSSREIRAQEATVQVTIDGVRQPMSAVIKNLSLKPDVDRPTTRYIGQKRAAADLDIKGWGVSFKCNRRDHSWMAIINAYQEAERNGDPLPEVTMAVSYSYRGGSTSTVTLHTDAVLFPDELSIPESGYLEDSWTGFFAELDG